MTNRWTDTSIVHGGLKQHEPDQQLNPAFQLQSLFKHAARLWGGCAQRLWGNLLDSFFFLQEKSANFWKDWVDIEEVIVSAGVIPDWNMRASREADVTSSPPLPPLIAHLLKAGQHPTHTKSCSLSLSPFLWTALCANYSSFPWQRVAPLFLLSWIAHGKHASQHSIRLRQQFILLRGWILFCSLLLKWSRTQHFKTYCNDSILLHDIHLFRAL